MVTHLGAKPKTPVEQYKKVKFGDWADSQMVHFENLYDTEQHYRGLETINPGITYDSPVVLACFLGQSPQKQYTLEGWMDFLKNN